MAYSVTLIEGLGVTKQRCVAFLECTDKSINAKRVFDALKQKQKDDVLSRFDYWQRGGVFDRYFHGWPNNQERKECFVFRWKEQRNHQRFYGFLTKPKPKTAPGFLVCVLVRYAQKNTEETDSAEFNIINRLRINPEVIEAVKRVFPDKEK